MNATPRTRPDDSVSTADAAATDDVLRGVVGYRVVDPGGEHGVVTGVPESGLPPRPLVLVMRAGDCFRFLSLRRVERVLPNLGEVVVRP